MALVTFAQNSHIVMQISEQPVWELEGQAFMALDSSRCALAQLVEVDTCVDPTMGRCTGDEIRCLTVLAFFPGLAKLL